MLWFRLIRPPYDRKVITLSNATDWKFEGETPVQVALGDRLPFEDMYSQLPIGNGLEIENLAESDSAVCLSGRIAGRSSTLRVLGSLCFHAESRVARLDELLALQGASDGHVSRVLFHNSRRSEDASVTSQTRLVVADGHDAFKRIVDKPQVRDFDVIGVIHRILDPEKLEDLSTTLENLGQWYATDEHWMSALPEPVRGISVGCVKRR
jgi:hypothetical protein